jgi:uncharacterized protein (TIRG00374 family)
MAERIVDVLILGLLLATTGFVIFRDRMGQIGIILLLGLGLAVACVVALVLMKAFSTHIQALLPERIVHRYVSFEEGALQSFRRLPLVFGLSAVIWLMEGGRLQLVFASLGLHTHISSIPFAPMLFFALGTAVLTTLPFTPGGLGVVEAVLGSAMVYLGIPIADAAAVVLMDRLLSYYSVALIGFAVYLVSKRSHFRHPV